MKYGLSVVQINISFVCNYIINKNLPISDAAFHYLSELRTLDVSCNKLIGGVFQSLAGHLASLSKLEILNLHQCCITEEDMLVLCKKYVEMPYNEL